jgi:hypothetical protein
MSTSPARFASILLAGMVYLVFMSGCTVVNYCVGTHVDEYRARKHCYRAGDDHMIKKQHAVTVITTGGATLHGTLVGTKPIRDRSVPVADSDQALEGLNMPVPMAGPPPENALCICLEMPDGSILEVPLEEVYLLRAEYGPPHLWRRILPVPGLVFDAAAILFINGVTLPQ